MSYLAIQGIPGNWTVAGTVKLIAKQVNGNFTALNFANNQKNRKTLYIQLSKYVDPYQAAERLNQGPVKKCFLKASVTNNVPDGVLKAKPRKLPFQLRKSLKIRDELSLEVVLQIAHSELVVELLSKYTGLFNLSRKSDHKLLDNISEIVLSRLLETVDRNPESVDNGFVVTKAYRKQHPHSNDFQLISNINKKLGGGDINKIEFTTVSTHPYVIDGIPYDKVQSICNKYSEKISKEVSEHLMRLQVQPDMEADTEDDIARKKVRAELKKIIPYLPSMIRQVIAQNFVPEKSPFHRIRVYGEPFLPPKDLMAPILKRHRAVKVTRSDRIYNMLKFNIPPQDYGSLIAMDGTVIGGATLVIRSSDMPLYTIPKEHVKRIRAHCGLQSNDQYPEDDGLGDDEFIDDDYFGEDIGDEPFDEDIDNGFIDEAAVDDEYEAGPNWGDEVRF